MLSALLFTAENSTALEIGEVHSALQAGDGLVWIDALDPTEETLSELCQVFTTNSFLVDQDERWRRRPKLRLNGDTLVIVGFANVGNPSDLAEVDLTMGRGWIVSVRHTNEDAQAYDPVEPIRRFETTRCGSTDPGMALHLILDDIVDGYFDMVEDVEDALEVIEESLFDDSDGAGMKTADPDVQHELLRMRRGLIQLRRKVIPLRDVLLELARGETQLLGASSQMSLQGVLDHLLRLVDQIDNQRELLGNVVEAHLALQANFMNQVMKKMTSWAAVLVVGTLITGVYGMNFDDMPELRWRFGYPAALLLIFSCTGGLWYYFRRKDWL